MIKLTEIRLPRKKLTLDYDEAVNEYEIPYFKACTAKDMLEFLAGETSQEMVKGETEYDILKKFQNGELFWRNGTLHKHDEPNWKAILAHVS